MARIAKSLKLEDRTKEYTIKELKNEHVFIILDMLENLDDSKEEQPAPKKKQSVNDLILKHLKDFLSWCSDITVEEFKDFSMSETMLIWEAFKAVNPFFFKMISRLQIPKKLETAVNLVLEMFVMGFAKSLQQLSDTAIQMPGTTAGALPKSPLKKL